MGTDLTQYDVKPEDFINYLRYYGPHFSKKLCEYAISKMNKGNKPYTKLTKEQLDQILSRYNVNIDKSTYDYLYLGNMVKADFYGSSIEDDRHLVLFIKDYLEDADGYDGIVFNRWYGDMCKKGIIINWEEML